MVCETTEEFVAMMDECQKSLGAKTLSEQLASVTIPEDLNPETWDVVKEARSNNQKISDYALKCLALYQKGQMTHKNYVSLARRFHDLEGITPVYLRQFR